MITPTEELLARLGKRLAELLDEDHWNEVEPILANLSIAIRSQAAQLEAERNNKKIAQDNADHWRKQYLDERDTLESLKTRTQQFQFCIEQVASALGVCCGGVDSSPEDQLSDPHSTTRVLCDAVKELKDSLESEIDAHNFTRIQLFDSRKALGLAIEDTAIARAARDYNEQCYEAEAKARKIAELKNQGTLANNLCPDHRAKQVDQPCLACTIERERKAREEWERGIRYHDGKNAYWENRAEAAEQDRDAFRELLAIHNLGGMTDFNIGPMKRALAAEQRLAAVFERTRERAAKVCEQTGHGAGECPEMANYCAENVRALQPEGEESAAAQENAKDQMSAQLPDGNVTPASAAALIPGLERTVRALGSNPICLRCGNTTDPWTCKIIPGDGVICLDCCRKENTEIERMK